MRNGKTISTKCEHKHYTLLRMRCTHSVWPATLRPNENSVRLLPARQYVLNSNGFVFLIPVALLPQQFFCVHDIKFAKRNEKKDDFGSLWISNDHLVIRRFEFLFELISLKIPRSTFHSLRLLCLRTLQKWMENDDSSSYSVNDVVINIQWRSKLTLELNFSSQFVNACAEFGYQNLKSITTTVSSTWFRKWHR